MNGIGAYLGAERGVGRSDGTARMISGTIKRMFPDRGFGFIEADDGRQYFFHRTGVIPPLDFDQLTGGQSVRFNIEPSAKGPRAIRVRAAEGAGSGGG